MIEKLKRTKGFTLVELLVTLAVIAILTSIVAVVVYKSNDSSESIVSKINIDNIANAATIYVKEFKLEDTYWEIEKGTSNEFTCTTIKQLKNMGYFSGKLVDSSTGEEYKDNTTIKITRDPNKVILSNIKLDAEVCDKTPPKITIEVIGNTKNSGGKNWYYDKDGTIVKISAVGKIVEYEYYIKNSSGASVSIIKGTTSGYENYETNLYEIIKDNSSYGANTKVCGYAINKNDINSDEVCETINVDFTIPSLPILTASDSVVSNNWHKNNFYLNVTGGGSSPSGIIYNYGTEETKINNRVNGNKITVSNSSKTTYYVNACNGVGVCSNYTSYISKIDKNKPTIVSLKKNTDAYVKSITLTGVLKDAESGIVKYKIAQENSYTATGWTTVTATNNNVTSTKTITKNGTYYIWVEDAAGNYNSTSIVVNNIDNIKPTIVSFKKNTDAYAKSVTLTGIFKDAESGIIKHKITTESSYVNSGWTTIPATNNNVTSTKTITANGTYYLWVEDALGNYKYTTIVIKNIDTTKPTISGLTSTLSSGGKSSTITATLKDTESGIVKYKITQESSYVNSGWTTIPATNNNVTSKKTVTANGTYYIWVEDALGNYNSTSIKITDIYIQTYNNAVPDKDYSEGETVTWGNECGLEWYVLKDNGDSVTLISKSNYKTGIYGTSVSFSSSTANSVLNNDFVNSCPKVSEAIKEKTLILDSSTNTYVRLVTKSELSSKIPNDSNTLFWTMTSSGSNMYAGNIDGTILQQYSDSGTKGTYDLYINKSDRYYVDKSCYSMGGNYTVCPEIKEFGEAGVETVAYENEWYTEVPDIETYYVSPSSSIVNFNVEYETGKGSNSIVSKKICPCEYGGGNNDISYFQNASRYEYTGNNNYPYDRTKSLDIIARNIDNDEVIELSVYYAEGYNDCDIKPALGGIFAPPCRYTIKNYSFAKASTSTIKQYYKLTQKESEMGYRPVITVLKKKA